MLAIPVWGRVYAQLCTGVERLKDWQRQKKQQELSECLQMTKNVLQPVLTTHLHSISPASPPDIEAEIAVDRARITFLVNGGVLFTVTFGTHALNLVWVRWCNDLYEAGEYDMDESHFEFLLEQIVRIKKLTGGHVAYYYPKSEGN